MNLHQLRLFCAVVETGSFALASERLYITQPALSIQIRRLERSLGVELLRRTRKGPVLTDAGQAVYESAKAIFERQEAMKRRLEEIRSGGAGTIVVALRSSGVLYFGFSVIRAFKRRFPATVIIPRVGKREEVLELVASGVVDLGFEWGPVANVRLNVVPLLQARFLVVLSPEHPLASRKTIAVSDFAREVFINLDHGPGTLSFVGETLLRAGIRPETVVQVPTIDAAKLAIEANVGISMLSSLSVEREVEGGLLAVRPLKGFGLDRDLVILRRNEGPVSTLAGAFIEFAKEYAASQQAAASHLRMLPRS